MFSVSVWENNFLTSPSAPTLPRPVTLKTTSIDQCSKLARFFVQTPPVIIIIIPIIIQNVPGKIIVTMIIINEPVHEKTNNLGFRPGPTQTWLYRHRRWLEAGNFGLRVKLYYQCSENKDADWLRSYCEADLCLCFRLCRLLIFSCSI